MSSPEALIIPAGANLAASEAGTAITNDGDIVLHNDLGGLSHLESQSGSVALHGDMTVGDITAAGDVELNGDITAGAINAGGSVTLNGDISTGDITGDSLATSGALKTSQIRAAGAVSLAGNVEAQNIHGDVIALDGESVKARAVRGESSITLSSDRISADILLSPTVSVGENTRGRIAVIESHNDIGPNALKGGFGLEEFAEFSGIEPAQFLAARGVTALGESAAPVDEPTADDVEEEPPAETNAEPEPEPEEEPVEEEPAEEEEPVEEEPPAADEPDEEPADEETEAAPEEPPVQEEPPAVDTVPVIIEKPTPAEVTAEEDDLDEIEPDLLDDPEPSEELKNEPEEPEPAEVEPEEVEPAEVEPEVVEPEPAPVELDPLQEKLLGILTQIDKCYTTGEEPPRSRSCAT